MSLRNSNEEGHDVDDAQIERHDERIVFVKPLVKNKPFDLHFGL